MTWSGQKFLAAISLAGAVALGGCAYDDGYYGGVSVGSGYYGGGYYDDYYGPGYYGSGYYGPGYGWYGDYYYPGSGYYVFDRGGRRHRWNDDQRRYWEGRRGQQGDHWRGSLARPEDGRLYRDGRPARDGRWRGRDRNDATAAPPPVQSQPRAGSPRGSWGGGRSGSGTGSGSVSNSGNGSSDGNHWRGTLRR